MSNLKTLLIFFLISLAINTNAQSSKKVKALRIKSTTEWIMNYTDGENTPKRKDVFTAFDKEGNTTEKIEYGKDESIKKRQTFKYDGHENLLEEYNYETKADKDSKENNNKKITWKYNSSDDKTEENLFDLNGKLLKKTIYSYNKNGDKNSETICDGEGKLIKKSIYIYDSKGLKKEKRTLDAENKLESVKIYDYTF